MITLFALTFVLLNNKWSKTADQTMDAGAIVGMIFVTGILDLIATYIIFGK